MRWTDESLQAYAREILVPLGKERVTANFEPFKEFKVNYSHGWKHAEFHVSDYLRDSPKHVVRDIIIGIVTGEKRKAYSGRTREWLMTRTKVKAFDAYAERHGLREGKHIDLAAFETGGTQVRFGPMWRDAAFTLLFDVIVINEEYDEPGAEEEIGKLIRGQMEELAMARELFSSGETE